MSQNAAETARDVFLSCSWWSNRFFTSWLLGRSELRSQELSSYQERSRQMVARDSYGRCWISHVHPCSIFRWYSTITWDLRIALQRLQRWNFKYEAKQRTCEGCSSLGWFRPICAGITCRFLVVASLRWTKLFRMMLFPIKMSPTNTGCRCYMLDVQRH